MTIKTKVLLVLFRIIPISHDTMELLDMRNTIKMQMCNIPSIVGLLHFALRALLIHQAAA